MLWSDIEDNVRIELPEKAEAFFTSQAVRRRGAIRQMEIAAVTGGVTTSTTLYCSPLVDEVSLPADFIEIEQAHNNGIPIYQIEEQRSYTESVIGLPTDYYIRQDPAGVRKMGFYPLQAGNTGTGTVSATTTAMTGVGTKFTEELEVGQKIASGTKLLEVASITSDTALTLVAAPATPVSATAFTIGAVIPIKYKHIPPEYGLKIMFNRTTGATSATAQITTTTLSVVIAGGAWASTTTFTLASYATFAALVTAIKATVINATSPLWASSCDVSSGISPTLLEDTPLTYNIMSPFPAPFFLKPELTQECYPCLEAGIMYDLRKRDKEDTRAKLELQVYESKLADLRRTFQKRIQTHSIVVKNSYANVDTNTYPNVNYQRHS